MTIFSVFLGEHTLARVCGLTTRRYSASERALPTAYLSFGSLQLRSDVFAHWAWAMGNCVLQPSTLWYVHDAVRVIKLIMEKRRS